MLRTPVRGEKEPHVWIKMGVWRSVETWNSVQSWENDKMGSSKKMSSGSTGWVSMVMGKGRRGIFFETDRYEKLGGGEKMNGRVWFSHRSNTRPHQEEGKNTPSKLAWFHNCTFTPHYSSQLPNNSSLRNGPHLFIHCVCLCDSF